MNIKNRGRLTYPNSSLYDLLSITEYYFEKNSELPDVYWATVDNVLSSYELTFPCSDHKDDLIAQILHYYLLMRMRQHCKQKNLSYGKKTKEKRKESKLHSK
jgi:hypothetical protein